MAAKGNVLHEQSIRGVLSTADLKARSEGDQLHDSKPRWVGIISFLKKPSCPKTYLPVLAILLTARGLKTKDKLDVLQIQKQAGPKGYSAPSIGKIIIPFATEQNVSLRSTSSQVMNNQPFTYKKKIEPGMSGPSKAKAFNFFYETAVEVNDLTQDEAIEILALIFHECRNVVTPPIIFETPTLGIEEMKEFFTAVAGFVDTHSDNGKVGQAFVASVLDLLYAPNVIMGHNSDPDVSLPGDVHILYQEEIWCCAEVKQKAITTGDVLTMIHKVQKFGGQRIFYFALSNNNYPKNISHKQADKKAKSEKVEITIFESPLLVLESLSPFFPGAPGEVVSTLASFFMSRLREAGVDPQHLLDFDQIFSAMF